MSSVRLGWLAIAVGMLGLACGNSDGSPPAPPWVDDLASPTRDPSPRVTGTAEFGATVTIAGGGQTVETVADPYTAKWAVEVTLARGANTLSVIATDAAGNASLPTEVAVELIPAGEPATVVLDGPRSSRAGEPVELSVLVLDVYGDPVPDAAFTLTTDASPGTTTLTPPSTLAFCELATTTITAQAGDGGPSASLTIAIEPGAPVAVALTTTPAPAVIQAGATVTYATLTSDSCGNPTSDRVEVFTNAPGAVAAGGTLGGLVRAGSWTIVAQVPGTSVADTADLLIGAEQASVAVALTLTSHSGIVGLPVGFSVTAVDGFGNPVSNTPAIAALTDPGAVIDLATRTVSFSMPGNHTITATVLGASDSDFVIVTDADAAAPAVAITAPAAGVVFAPNGTMAVTVQASDDRGLAQVFLQASGGVDYFASRLVPAGAGVGAPFVTTFDVDIGGNRFGDVTLVAQAVDLRGNYTTSSAVVVRVDPALNLVAPGLTAQTVAFGGFLNGPRGLAVDATGNLYAANNGGGAAVVRIDAATGAQTAFTPSIGGAGPEDIVFYPAAGTFFLTARGTSTLYRVSAAGTPTSFATAFNGAPRGVTLDLEGGADRVLAVDDAGFLRRFNPTAAPIAGATFVMDASNELSTNAWGVARVSATRYAGCDEGNDECHAFTAPGTSGNTVTGAARVARNTPLDQPRDVVLSPDGSALYVANEGDGRILRIQIAGCTTNPCATTTIVSGLDRAWGLVFASATELLVSDEGNDVIYRLTGAF